MEIKRPLRVSLLSAMVLVALAAVWLGWVASERRKRVALLNVEFRQKEERVRWADRMQRLGYVSKAVLASEQAHLKKIESELTQLGEIPKKD